MRELTAVAQVSLDGFIAGPNGEFDHFIGGEENLEFICNIIKSADAAMMGRVSFELLDADWPTAGNKPGASKNVIQYSNWYNAVPKIVFSKTLSDEHRKDLVVLKNTFSAEVEKLKLQQGKNIVIFGSPTILNELLQFDSIDNIWLIIHPVLFGNGIPLFRKSNQIKSLLLQISHQLKNGTLCNKYLVRK